MHSIVRSLRSVDRADIVVLVLDAQDGVTEQDKKKLQVMLTKRVRCSHCCE